MSLCGLCDQVESLQLTLSNNAADLSEMQKRLQELQTVVIAGEHDRCVLQEQLNITRSIFLVMVIRCDLQ